jgi:hypothetical protein
VSNCTSTLQNANYFDCAGFSCATGTVFNRATAATCVTDLSDLPCGDFPPDGGAPAEPLSCGSICGAEP